MRRSFPLVAHKAAGYAALLLTLAALISAVLVSPTPAAAESTISCPAGTYDMLDWMTLDSDLNLSSGRNQQPAVHGSRVRQVLLGEGRARLPLGHSAVRLQLYLSVDHGTLVHSPGQL